MIRFLRQFAAFRSVEAALIDAKTERLVLKGRADAECEARLKAEAALERIERELADWKAKSAQQDAEIQALNARLIEEAHKVADTMSIHAIGKRVFSKAEMPTPTPAHTVPITHGRQFMRDVQVQQRRDTRQALKEMWDKLPTREN